MRVLSMIGLSLAGATLQWASAFVLLIYVNARVSSDGGGFSLPIVGEVDVSISGSDRTLFAWGAIALVLVVCAALTGYGAQALGFDIARRYTRRAGGRILSAVQTDPDVLAVVASEQQDLEPAHVLRNTMQRETTKVLRVLFLIMRSVHSVARLLVAGVLIILIDPLLTLVLVALGLLFLVPLYGVNRRTARASVTYEGANRDASRYTAWLATLVLSSDRTQESAERLSNRYEESEVVDHRLGALSEIVLTRYRTQYIVAVFTGLAAVVIVFAFALSGTDDVGGWTTALIYLVALLAASASLNAISVTVTGASRFLPQVRRYTDLMQVAGAAKAGEEERVGRSPAPAGRLISLGPEGLDGSLPSLELDLGRPVFVHARERPDRTTLAGFLARLFGLSGSESAALRRDVYLCGDVTPPPMASTRRPLGNAGPESADAYVESAGEGLRGGASIVILGWRSFSRLDGAVRDRLLAGADHALVLLVSDRMPGGQPEEAVATVLLDEHGVRGIGDSDLHRKWARQLPIERERGVNTEGEQDLEGDLDEI